MIFFPSKEILELTKGPRIRERESRRAWEALCPAPRLGGACPRPLLPPGHSRPEI